MRINARLDDGASRKLAYLKDATGWSVSEILRRAIDALHGRIRAQTSAAEVLKEEGFVGCSDGPSELSTTYKDDLASALADKHDSR